jgi:hypothetical protein
LEFDAKSYGEKVAAILNADESGYRLMPLVSAESNASTGRDLLKDQKAIDLFPTAISPDAALAGLWLYFSGFEECHEIAQNLSTPEGHFWHAIIHRQEPDSGNSAYWFRHTGQHPIFRELSHQADLILAANPDAEFRTGGKWDPFSFILFCERARQQPNSSSERAALEIQRAEWQLLFHHCARPIEK